MNSMSIDSDSDHQPGLVRGDRFSDNTAVAHCSLRVALAAKNGSSEEDGFPYVDEDTLTLKCFRLCMRKTTGKQTKKTLSRIHVMPIHQYIMI